MKGSVPFCEQWGDKSQKGSVPFFESEVAMLRAIKGTDPFSELSA